MLEVCLQNPDGKVERVCTINDMIQEVKGVQQCAMMRHHIVTKNVAGEDISLELYETNSERPRYTLHIVDLDKRTANRFAIFIVPMGK